MTERAATMVTKESQGSRQNYRPSHVRRDGECVVLNLRGHAPQLFQYLGTLHHRPPWPDSSIMNSRADAFSKSRCHASCGSGAP